MERVTVEAIRGRKGGGEKLTMLTAYDHPTAKIIDAAGADMILVGDSLGMVVLGYETTEPVTMEEMLHHAKAVRRGVARAMVIGDMPLVSLQAGPDGALRDARRFTEEARCEAVKVEWRAGVEQIVKGIVADKIPVMGHVGLTPQTASREGGFGMRGKDAESAVKILDQASALEAAGCFAMVLECIPDVVARDISRRLRIPTIGIGSGPWCDGQVMVTNDLVGLFDRFTPRFVKRYADLNPQIKAAVSAYLHDVRAGTFPGEAQTVTMVPEEAAKFERLLAT
jgi:3-methyl-2-oxobutanoate hydroxymethyltransferase